MGRRQPTPRRPGHRHHRQVRCLRRNIPRRHHLRRPRTHRRPIRRRLHRLHPSRHHRHQRAPRVLPRANQTHHETVALRGVPGRSHVAHPNLGVDQLPAKGIQVNCGGHSMPGVNETISATIQAGFDMLGSLFFVSSLGATVDTMLKPLYEDTVLAWWSVKNGSRAINSGWERLFEYFQQGANKAYTIASLMVLRAGFWATKTTVSWKVKVSDGLPFMVGDRGLGHFFLDDRVGLVLEGDTQIHMDRARKLELVWSEDGYT